MPLGYRRLKRTFWIASFKQIQCPKLYKKNSNRSGVYVSFQIHSHFRCLLVLCAEWNYFYHALSYNIDFKAPRAFWSNWVRRTLVKFTFTGRAGIINATVYRKKTIPQALHRAYCPNSNTANVTLHVHLYKHLLGNIMLTHGTYLKHTTLNMMLTHWGRVTHLSKLTIIDNAL